MKIVMRFTGIVLAVVLSTAGRSHGSEVRSYISKSRLVIENGYAYKITPVLYADLEINGKNIIKRTYAVSGGGANLISEVAFVAVSSSNEDISDTMPKWLKRIKKIMGRALPAESEDIIRATNVDEVKGLKARSLVTLTIGKSFLIEVDAQCPYPSLVKANIIEYGYYEISGRKAFR